MDSPFPGRYTTSAMDADGRMIYFDDLVAHGEYVTVEGHRMVVLYDPKAPEWYIEDAPESVSAPLVRIGRS